MDRYKFLISQYQDIEKTQQKIPQPSTQETPQSSTYHYKNFVLYVIHSFSLPTPPATPISALFSYHCFLLAINQQHLTPPDTQDSYLKNAHKYLPAPVCAHWSTNDFKSTYQKLVNSYTDSIKVIWLYNRSITQSRSEQIDKPLRYVLFALFALNPDATLRKVGIDL